jgi:hypothetical protein
MGDILNDLTNAQLSALRERALNKTVERACLWCGKITPMRKDQRFCCPAHRAAFSRASAELLHAELVLERSRWQREREELLREIADLRRQLTPGS